ncbi:hypothetical protein ACQKEY_00085 [Lysinibacillus fusiformis]|uniref:hypothetical protein n=1 Tax=Lysinibacillus fusiformis TaxID=28031 RepID=UPI000D3A927A|nr:MULTISPECIES: hypothetical protein [Lysinibacillus]MED4669814.1 hypothetical protein [Lysinibacillus fusiformis]QAS55692.1 hypothetical protein LSP_04490 [Lysinibacillus sphaericus]RDV27717.1 hypothetical protein C7B90_19220 [Lysinibacillus fusiformis]GED64080.1 hypothetical protein LFU01_25320 [Lysinibacillus fusiformis]
MIPTSIEVSLDKQAIRKYIEKWLDEEIREVLWLIDLQKMSELTNMSPRFLENEIVRDARMRAIEIKKHRKRWWPYQEAFEVVREITNGW